MRIFAISDLHLSFDMSKPMDIFGPVWQDHPQKIRNAWKSLVREGDLVLIPGDISWSLKLEDARQDLEFIADLPGTKVIIKGNHDYWWTSLQKVRQAMPASIIPLQNTSLVFEDVGISGSRLWIDPDLNLEEASEKDRKIWEREIARLKLSLDDLGGGVRKRIIMSHFPPISLDGKLSKAARMTNDYQCDIWIFGHMHLGNNLDYNGFNRTIDSTRYVFVSADYLDFSPILILDE